MARCLSAGIGEKLRYLSGSEGEVGVSKQNEGEAGCLNRSEGEIGVPKQEW